MTFALVQNQSGSDFTDEEAETGNSGLATVGYVSGPNSGVDILRVTVEGASVEAQLVLNIVPGNLTPASIALVSNPSVIQVEGATSAMVTATVRNALGQGLPGIQVNLNTTLGQIFGTGARAAGITGNTGAAAFVLQAGTVSGRANLTAQAGSISNSLLVDILPGAPAIIGSLSASPANPGANSQAMLQARVTDQYGNPVPSVEVSFLLIQNQSGSDFSSGQETTDAGGWATLGYTTGPNVGTDIFRISTPTLSSEENLLVQLAPNTQTVGSISLSVVGDTAIPADGSSSTILEAVVLDLYGDPIPGVSINFSQSMGALTATSALTNAEGKVRVSLISGTAPGEVTVTATSGALSDLVTVWFVSTVTEIGSIDLEVIGPTTIPADGKSSTAFEVTVLDSSGDPLEGVTVNLSADSGTLSSMFVKTNSEGKALASLISSPWPGLVAIVAEADGVTDSAYVTFEEIQQYHVGGIDIEVLGPTAILADGKSSSTIKATVVDSGGNPLSQAVVYFSTTLGSVSENYMLTNEDGECQVSLKSGATGGQAVVQATAGSFSDSAYVTFLQAHAINVYCVNDEDEIVENPTVYADGTSSIRVQALVQDTFVQPLQDVVVSFSSSDALLGTVAPGQAATNEEGIAQVSLIGTGVGIVKITGSIGGLTDSVYVTVTAPPAR